MRGFQGKHTGVGCHFLLWGIFLTQGLNLCLLHWAGSFFTTEPLGKPTLLDNKGKIPGVTRIRVTAMDQKGWGGLQLPDCPWPPCLIWGPSPTWAFYAWPFFSTMDITAWLWFPCLWHALNSPLLQWCLVMAPLSVCFLISRKSLGQTAWPFPGGTQGTPAACRKECWLTLIRMTTGKQILSLMGSSQLGVQLPKSRWLNTRRLWLALDTCPHWVNQLGDLNVL